MSSKGKFIIVRLSGTVSGGMVITLGSHHRDPGLMLGGTLVVVVAVAMAVAAPAMAAAVAAAAVAAVAAAAVVVVVVVVVVIVQLVSYQHDSQSGTSFKNIVKLIRRFIALFAGCMLIMYN